MDGKSTAKYQFFPSVPITAWLVLAGLVIVSIALFNFDAVGWRWAGGILLACSLLGALFVALSVRAAKLVVELDDYGYRIDNGDQVHSGAWADVTSVSATPEGNRLVIRRGPVARDYIIAPKGASVERMAQLTADLQRRLSAESH